jgi:hypothetical protein
VPFTKAVVLGRAEVMHIKVSLSRFRKMRKLGWVVTVKANGLLN